MKGVILSVNPAARIVDISHQIAPHNVVEATFLLAASYRFFPQGTIHLAVVDPGVGSRRRPIAIQTERYIFVGPDNGLFTEALKEEKIETIVELTEQGYMLSSVSNTFHGRDIFAPVAAHLSKGLAPERLGRRLDRVERLNLPVATRVDDRIVGEVVYVDGFGNLITNIDEQLIGAASLDSVSFEIKGATIEGLSTCYADSDGSSPVAIVGSTGRVEIALYMGRADRHLNATVGDTVVARLKR